MLNGNPTTMLNALRRRCAKTSAKWRNSYVKRFAIAPVFAAIPREALILEIGGGYNPRFVKGAEHPNVYHLDHASTADLRAKYGADPKVAQHVHRIQPIDFVFDGTPIETLVPPELRFDVIFGSHTLEHQVDLIGHLQSVEKLLGPGGRVIHIVPDLRACFDALRYPTVTSDALLAHVYPAPTHRGKQAFDTRARTMDKNHGYLMCDADFDDAALCNPLPAALAAMRAADDPAQGYLDAHAWTFTPGSFRLLMIELRLLGLTRLVPTSVSSTYGNQFCAVLERSDKDPAALPPATVAALERERLMLSVGLRTRT
jgi:SAM-dependent methyltransferase